MKNLFEVVKENKEKVIKGALLVGGTVLGAILANTLSNQEDNNHEEYEILFDDTEDDEEVVIDIQPKEEE